MEKNAFLSISSQTEITGSSCICSALPVWSWGRSESRPQKQVPWQADKRGTEIVADNKRQYFIKGDDRSCRQARVCKQAPVKRPNERSFVHHLIRGEATWLYAIRSAGWTGRKSMKHFRFDVWAAARDSTSLWLWGDTEIQDVAGFNWVRLQGEQWERERKRYQHMCPLFHWCEPLSSHARYKSSDTLRFWFYLYLTKTCSELRKRHYAVMAHFNS